MDSNQFFAEVVNTIRELHTAAVKEKLLADWPLEVQYSNSGASIYFTVYTPHTDDPDDYEDSFIVRISDHDGHVGNVDFDNRFDLDTDQSSRCGCTGFQETPDYKVRPREAAR